MIAEFRPIARAVIGLNNLKIISFGPRPLNFLACNAPIQQLYNLGVEIKKKTQSSIYLKRLISMKATREYPM